MHAPLVVAVVVIIILHIIILDLFSLFKIAFEERPPRVLPPKDTPPPVEVEARRKAVPPYPGRTIDHGNRQQPRLLSS
jgi:hypothetical protein